MSGAAPALIAAVMALIAAAIAFFAALITKDIKITEFRQAWINDQRKDLAAVAALARKMHAVADKTRLAADLKSFDEAVERIALRENPVKSEWAKPISSITRLRELILSSAKVDAQMDFELADLRASSQTLMKAEWDRVRSGEPTYLTGRKVLLRFIIVMALALPVAILALAYGKGFIVLGSLCVCNG